MKKKAASILLFSNLGTQRFIKAAPFLPRNCCSHDFPPSSSSPFSSKLSSTSLPLQTHGLIFKLHQFQTNPSRNLCTIAEKPTRLSSAQKKPREKSELREAFSSAQTSDELIRAFEDKEREGCFDEGELGLNALHVAQKLDGEGGDPEKILSLAERALKAMEKDQDTNGKPSLFVSIALHLMGTASRSLKRLDQSESYSNRALRALAKFGERCYSIELDLTGESERSEWLRDDIGVANMQIESGKYDEAINTLESIMERTETDSENRAMLFISMGKVLCLQEKFADSKRYLQSACEILDNKDTVSLSPIEVADAYAGISMLYEKMNEFETAISLSKKLLVLLEKQPEEQKFQGYVSARIGQLLLLRGEAPQAIPYLDGAAEILKESSDSNCIRLFNMFCTLGTTYLELDRPESAAEMFEVAKGIIYDSLLDPHDADSVEARQQLSNAYSDMGSYTNAIEIQQRVIDAWERHREPRAEDELKEARRILEDLKTKACGTSHHGDPVEGPESKE